MDLLWITITIATGSMLVATVVVLFVLMRRAGQEQARQAAALESMQKDLRALCTASVSMGERINRLEQGVKQVAQRQEEIGMRQDRLDRSDGGDQAYAQAIKLVRKGAGVDELMEICGLARGEAELITMMHRMGRAS